MSRMLQSLKGQCHEIFSLSFFHQNTSPGPIRGTLRPFPFLPNFGVFLRKKVGLAVSETPGKSTPPVSGTPGKSTPPVSRTPVGCYQAMTQLLKQQSFKKCTICVLYYNGGIDL